RASAHPSRRRPKGNRAPYSAPCSSHAYSPPHRALTVSRWIKHNNRGLRVSSAPISARQAPTFERSPSACLAALQVVAMRFGAVAAGAHRAPAAIAALAVVEEQPDALRVGTAPHLDESSTGQEIARRP